MQRYSLRTRLPSSIINAKSEFSYMKKMYSVFINCCPALVNCIKQTQLALGCVCASVLILTTVIRQIQTTWDQLQSDM